MRRGVNLCVPVCLHLAIEVQKMSSDSESNSSANLSRISDGHIMEENEEDVEESNTQTDVTRGCHVGF